MSCEILDVHGREHAQSLEPLTPGASANSSGRPIRPSETPAARRRGTPPVRGTESARALKKLTRMSRPLGSMIQLRAKFRTAALVAASTLAPGILISEVVDPIKITDEISARSGNACCTVNTTPLTFLANVA
jgi:hypothetical protein